MGSSMRVAMILFVVACGSTVKPDLSGSYGCGSNTCGSGQICVEVYAGSQCDVNLDAGIPEYGLARADCEELPASCDGALSCECAGGSQLCIVSGNGRELDLDCI
jgi:hypothetical protein